MRAVKNTSLYWVPFSVVYPYLVLTDDTSETLNVSTLPDELSVPVNGSCEVPSESLTRQFADAS